MAVGEQPPWPGGEQQAVALRTATVQVDREVDVLRQQLRVGAEPGDVDEDVDTGRALLADQRQQRTQPARPQQYPTVLGESAGEGTQGRHDRQQVSQAEGSEDREAGLAVAV